MHGLLLLSASLYVSYLIPFSRAIQFQEVNHLPGNKTTFTYLDKRDERLIINGGKDDGRLDTSKDYMEDKDFEDDDDDISIYFQNFLKSSKDSVRNFQEKKGEILVPCFGMWWPMGGPSYDYVGDYYGDGDDRRRRRRTRKQKKTARTKRKKS